jgi:hypothetical protein
MSQRTMPRILDGLIKVERNTLEQLRGPAMVLLTKIKDFVTATAQPVVNVRSGNRSVAAGPTPDAPVLVWGAGGFELSSCLDQGDGALSLPLETDHTAFFASGKLSDPATPRLHDRALAVSLPFRVAKAVAAGEGDIYLGHPGKGLHLRINRDALLLELEVAGVGAKIRLGKAAVLGVARTTDAVGLSAAMQTWVTAVTVATAVPALIGTQVGVITGGSSIVECA